MAKRLSREMVRDVSLHNAGNDSYWGMHVFLELMTRYEERAKNGTGHTQVKRGKAPILVFVDFEAWVFGMPPPQLKKWQEIGIAVLDLCLAWGRTPRQLKEHMNTYHFVNKLYAMQVANAGSIKNAHPQGGMCRPYKFLHGQTYDVHQGIAADIIRAF